MSYREIRVPEELSSSVQLAVGATPRSRETLGELVEGIATECWVPRPENRKKGRSHG